MNFKYHLYARPEYKVLLSLSVAFLYFYTCLQYSSHWIEDISNVYNYPLALSVVLFVALIPGFINAFIFMGLLLDRKPSNNHIDKDLPPISILIAAYNEEDNINSTLESVILQEYPNEIQCIVINDGSTDNTALKVKHFIKSNDIPYNINIKLLDLKNNVGKANALNSGLKLVKNKNLITIDGDSWLYKDALMILVSDFIHSNNVAMAGTILVKNSRKNWLTKMQEQDYQCSIVSIKRTQHLCNSGVLVAQGALSIYKTWVIKECNGWQPVVGEDIILSWDILNRGYSIGHSDNSICWTNVPETYKQYFQQRRRWARGLFEALRRFPTIIFTPKTFVIFIWFNLMFPFLDFYYTFVFIPSIIMALVFQYYLIVSGMTLMLIPLGILMNSLMLKVQYNAFQFHGLKFRKHYGWMLMYFLFGNLLSAPASLRGYADELLNTKKSWGTK